MTEKCTQCMTEKRTYEVLPTLMLGAGKRSRGKLGPRERGTCQVPRTWMCALVVRISYHLEIAVPFSIPPNETAIKKKNLGRKNP